MKLRPEVERFALLMEVAMQARDAERADSWRGGPIEFYVDRLHQEIDELVVALYMSKGYPAEYLRRVKKEAADVANFCMMIAEEIDNPEARR